MSSPTSNPTQEEIREKNAATKIQTIFRGFAQRQRTATAMQAMTPHASSAAYHMATNNYSPHALEERPFGSDQRQAEWGVYHSTSDLVPGQPALLHSFQREDDLVQELHARGNFDFTKKGNIYQPAEFGHGQGHDMRTNSAWLLGLAHHGVSAVMTTPLDDTTLIRDSSRSKPLSEQTTEKNFSALGREVLGMVQNDHFQPMVGPRDKQILTPTLSARTATIQSFQTPPGKPQTEIKAALANKGIDVTGIT